MACIAKGPQRTVQPAAASGARLGPFDERTDGRVPAGQMSGGLDEQVGSPPRLCARLSAAK